MARIYIRRKVPGKGWRYKSVPAGAGRRPTFETDTKFQTNHVVGKEFQGDAAMQARVLGFINHTHTTTADLFQNAVVGNSAADDGGGIGHWAWMLRPAPQIKQS
ncbi:MAG TPA: hypothetical protein VOA41_07460 [Candidatus Dormibacteraeota bacterium]|nr:hypothetical protein [Candidatus Dormibacteraeota bacterium]